MKASSKQEKTILQTLIIVAEKIKIKREERKAYWQINSTVWPAEYQEIYIYIYTYITCFLHKHNKSQTKLDMVDDQFPLKPKKSIGTWQKDRWRNLTPLVALELTSRISKLENTVLTTQFRATLNYIIVHLKACFIQKQKNQINLRSTASKCSTPRIK